MDQLAYGAAFVSRSMWRSFSSFGSGRVCRCFSREFWRMWKPGRLGEIGVSSMADACGSWSAMLSWAFGFEAGYCSRERLLRIAIESLWGVVLRLLFNSIRHTLRDVERGDQLCGRSCRSAKTCRLNKSLIHARNSWTRDSVTPRAFEFLHRADRPPFRAFFVLPILSHTSVSQRLWCVSFSISDNMWLLECDGDVFHGKLPLHSCPRQF